MKFAINILIKKIINPIFKKIENLISKIAAIILTFEKIAIILTLKK